MTKYRCTDCEQEYDGELEVCPNCGCPTKYQTVQVEQPSLEIDHSQDTTGQERNGVKLARPKIVNNGVAKMVARRCPACNAPLRTDAYNAKKTVCEYCGQTINFVFEYEDRHDNNEACLVLMPRKTDKDCKTKLLEELVLTDYVPVDVFDSLDFDTTRRNLYPVYVFDVNWSATWSAKYSYRVSHEVPDYDYQGKFKGMKTEWEIKSRDAIGTSAGDAMIVLPGLSEGFSNQIELCTKYTGILSNSPEIIENEAKELADLDTRLLDGWNCIYHNLDEQEAWKKGGKDVLARFVDSGVLQSVSNMADGSNVDASNYTYRYHKNAENKVMIPVWETDFRYEGRSYIASIDASQNTSIMGDCPKEEAAESQKLEIQKLFKKYKRRRTWGCVLFGVFSFCFVFLVAFFGSSDWKYLGYDKHRELYFTFSVVAGIAAFLTWIFMRKMHQTRMDLENSTNNKYWVEKKHRQAAVHKKFGIIVDIGKEPRMRKMSCVFDIIVISIITIIMIVNVIRYLT